MKPLEKLFEPITIGSMELRNRIVMPPMAMLWVEDGSPTQRLIDYYEARARGGVGLIISGITNISGSEPYGMPTLELWDDTYIPGFRELANAVHVHGAKLAPQLAHPGPESFSFMSGGQPGGPSPIRNGFTQQVPRELTSGEIEQIVDQFGEAVRRAREAGCDGIELHAAHAYSLVGSFLSPLRNKRTDDYGGSIEGRLKLLLEIIKAIRTKAGSDFPIILRISGDEMITGGRGIEETQYIAPTLVEAGVDVFDVSAGVMPDLAWRILPPTGTPFGLHVGLATAVKEVVTVPVIAVGRINDPRRAEAILDRGQADLVAMGRSLLADPELPNKAAAGMFEDIVPCISCGLGCLGTSSTGATCVINPAMGRENEMTITPAAKPKKVVVVGGGPGGLEAASVAALRGHRVTLFEKASKLGGQYNLAAIPPLKQEVSLHLKYLSRQVKKAGVEAKLNTEVTPKLIEELKPDVVIVATGAVPSIPDLPGIKQDIVITAHDLLAGKAGMGAKNVIIVGGGMVGCEVADLLANLGDNPIMDRTNVSIVTRQQDIGLDLVTQQRSLLMERLREKGVKVITQTTVLEIIDDGVVVTRNGQNEAIHGMDCIILARGMKAVDELSDKIGDRVSEIYVIGDAKEPRRALEAIAEGAAVARKI